MTLRAQHSKRGSAAISASPLRNVMALLCLLAFTLQGFVAQTHIHDFSTGSPQVQGAIWQTGANHKPASPDQAPDDSGKCPLCQVAASLNAAIGVTVSLIILPVSGLAILPAGADLPTPRSPPSYVWRSRGPPQH